MPVSLLLVGTVGLALTYAFSNGLHDATALTSTSVGSRSMTPRTAVAVATIANLVGGLTSTAVATTIATRLLADASPPTLDVLVAALAGALVWTLLTWYLSLPASASYALLGGLFGASLLAEGPGTLRLGNLGRLVLVPSLAVPLLALVLAFVLLRASARLVRGRPLARAFAGLRLAQIGTSTLISFAHGLADAQKTMAVIVLALIASGRQPAFTIPTWVVVASAAALAVGTLVGGLRGVRRWGVRVHRIEPPAGFAIQAAATLGVLYASVLGFPVSTTQAVTGASIGVSRRGRGRALLTSVVVELVLPAVAAAVVAALVYLPLRLH